MSTSPLVYNTSVKNIKIKIDLLISLDFSSIKFFSYSSKESTHSFFKYPSSEIFNEYVLRLLTRSIFEVLRVIVKKEEK